MIDANPIFDYVNKSEKSKEEICSLIAHALSNVYVKNDITKLIDEFADIIYQSQ